MLSVLVPPGPSRMSPSEGPLPEDFDMQAKLQEIRAALPSIPLDEARPLANGFDNIAIATPDHIFRFPRHDDARERLRVEARLLDLIRPRVELAVPELWLNEDPLFSIHALIPGETLDAAAYLELSETQKDELAETLAQFYAQLHDIPIEAAQDVGAGPAETFPEARELLPTVLPLLDPGHHDWAKTVLKRMGELPPDPFTVFSWFDGHGWNMAFDRRARRLNGVFDFADAGIGGLHTDLMHTNLIHADLTNRLSLGYARLTGRDIDPHRLSILTGFHRLADLAEAHDHPEFGHLTLELLTDWLSRAESRV